MKKPCLFAVGLLALGLQACGDDDEPGVKPIESVRAMCEQKVDPCQLPSAEACVAVLEASGCAQQMLDVVNCALPFAENAAAACTVQDLDHQMDTQTTLLFLANCQDTLRTYSACAAANAPQETPDDPEKPGEPDTTPKTIAEYCEATYSKCQYESAAACEAGIQLSETCSQALLDAYGCAAPLVEVDLCFNADRTTLMTAMAPALSACSNHLPALQACLAAE